MSDFEEGLIFCFLFLVKKKKVGTWYHQRKIKRFHGQFPEHTGIMNSTQELFALLTISLKNRESWLAILESALYLTVILTAFLGNTLFVLAFSNMPSLHSPQNCYLVSLAIVDILNAVVCIPITLKLAVSIKGKWDFSDVICQLQGSLISVVSTVSLLTLCMIAINRYVKITRPHQINCILKLFVK